MKKKKVVITQSNYIPWPGYFDAIRSVDLVILLDTVQYTRRDWRNRNRIKTPTGAQWLSIPVLVKDKMSQLICETQIEDKRWSTTHWKTIKSNYARAPHFKGISPFLEELYQDSNEIFLSKINERFLKTICSFLGITTPLILSADFESASGKTERLVDLCKQVGATDYYSGPAAKAYMDESLFYEAGISVHYFDYPAYPTYHQLHGEFVPNLSIIDLLFNEGPNALSFMQGLT